MREVFSYKDYKAYIRDQIEANRDIRGYRQRLADAAGCQRTYLSQVLNSHVELTPDHAAAMASYWGLSATAADYFLELVGLSRAATPALKKLILARMERLKKSQSDLAARINAPTLAEGAQEALYYSSWLFSALHLAIRLRACRTSASAGAYLGVPAELAKSYLEAMAAIGLVREEGGQWRALAGNLHLPKSSPYLWRHHQNWREIALKAAQSHDGGAIHFTSVHTLSAKDYERLSELLREFILQSRQLIEPSEDERAACLCIDYFDLDQVRPRV